MLKAEVRKLLADRLRTNSDFDAFCIDMFPESYREFTDGMNRTARINMLLAVHGTDALVAALRRRNSTQAPQRVFYVPQQLSPRFAGREHIRQELRRQIIDKKIVALWGLGGMGKTQTALSFADCYRNNYDSVLWISGDSITVFEQGLFEIARPLVNGGFLQRSLLDEHEPAAVRQAVVDYLRQSSTYLLICDNVDSPLSLRHIWPRNLAGHVLFTSRSHDIRRLGAVVVNLDTLSDKESRDYLISCHASTGPEEEQAVQELVDELQGLPLALAQAAAYIIRHKSRYDTYLRGYKKKKLGLLEQGLPDEDYPYSVATTWAMSLEQVEQGSAASLALLKLCSLLQPDVIPEEIFSRAVNEMDEPLRSMLREREDDEQVLDALLEPLLCHALMQRDPTNRALSMHRLVQQAVLHRLSLDEQARCGRAAVVLLNGVFPKPEFSTWTQCRRLLPQVLVLSEQIKHGTIEHAASGRLLCAGGEFLHEQAQEGEAAALFSLSLDVRQKAFGREHPEVADSLNGLACVVRAQGDLCRAEQLFQEAVAIREKALGSEHLDVAESLNDLAIVLDDLGRYGEAETLYRRSMAIKEKTLGSEHRLVATSLHNQGWLLRAQGRLEEAEPVCRRAMDIYVRTLGPEHPDVSYPMHILAEVLRAQGRLEEAEPLFRRALTIRENALPPGHPRIAQTRQALDDLLSQGKSSSALSAPQVNEDVKEKRNHEN